jgi:hypothetical protein
MDDIIDDSKIPTLYQELISIFLESISYSLLLHYLFDEAIALKDSNELVWSPIYALSETELTMLKEYFEEILWTGKLNLLNSRPKLLSSLYLKVMVVNYICM